MDTSTLVTALVDKIEPQLDAAGFKGASRLARQIAQFLASNRSKSPPVDASQIVAHISDAEFGDLVVGDSQEEGKAAARRIAEWIIDELKPASLRILSTEQEFPAGRICDCCTARIWFDCDLEDRIDEDGAAMSSTQIPPCSNCRHWGGACNIPSTPALEVVILKAQNGDNLVPSKRPSKKGPIEQSKLPYGWKESSTGRNSLVAPQLAQPLLDRFRAKKGSSDVQGNTQRKRKAYKLNHPRSKDGDDTASLPEPASKKQKQKQKQEVPPRPFAEHDVTPPSEHLFNGQRWAKGLEAPDGTRFELYATFSEEEAAECEEKGWRACWFIIDSKGDIVASPLQSAYTAPTHASHGQDHQAEPSQPGSDRDTASGAARTFPKSSKMTVMTRPKASYKRTVKPLPKPTSQSTLDSNAEVVPTFSVGAPAERSSRSECKPAAKEATTASLDDDGDHPHGKKSEDGDDDDNKSQGRA